MRLVIFDVDGTLVDSQRDIVGGITHTFQVAGRPVPQASDIVATIGMSLPETMRRLAPKADRDELIALVEGYKRTYTQLRQFAGSKDSSPLYPGAQAALDRLRARPEMLLAVATGKSRRGLRILIDGHGLDGYFQSQQCADDHPSKPHPSMILAALEETGVAPAHAIMVGDTEFDRQMAAAAGVAFLGVSWGYHPASALGNHVIDDFAALDPAVDHALGAPA